MVGVEAEVLHGDEAVGFVQGRFEFFTRDADVRDVEFVLCEFSAEEDESEVSVRWYEAALVSFGEEAVFAVLDVISERMVQHSGEGDAVG